MAHSGEKMKAEKIIRELVTLRSFDKEMNDETAGEFRNVFDAACNCITEVCEDDEADQLEKAKFAMLPAAVHAMPENATPEQCAAIVANIETLATAFVGSSKSADRSKAIKSLQEESDRYMRQLGEIAVGCEALEDRAASLEREIETSAATAAELQAKLAAMTETAIELAKRLGDKEKIMELTKV